MKLLLISFFILTSIIACDRQQQNNTTDQNNSESELNQITFQTQQLKSEPDEIAPDGSKIFLLTRVNGGSMCLCELPASETTQAVRHKTIEEIWFFLSGEGEVWREMNGKEEVTEVSRDISITIPLGCHFQFRNTGKEPLRFIIVTMPPWPGKEETVKAGNYWINE